MRYPFLAAMLIASSAPGWTTPPPAGDAAIFRAAGFAARAGIWRSACDDPGTASYTAGAIERPGDLNGDGLPEALITESSSYCYGDTGTAFWLLSQQRGGGWRLMLQQTGVAEFLAARGSGNWPDISVGGPGFCFAVLRWNGRAYVRNRFEYQGRRCRPPG